MLNLLNNSFMSAANTKYSLPPENIENDSIHLNTNVFTYIMLPTKLNRDYFFF
jgi:hypothetical protein